MKTRLREGGEQWMDGWMAGMDPWNESPEEHFRPFLISFSGGRERGDVPLGTRTSQSATSNIYSFPLFLNPISLIHPLYLVPSVKFLQPAFSSFSLLFFGRKLCKFQTHIIFRRNTEHVLIKWASRNRGKSQDGEREEERGAHRLWRLKLILVGSLAAFSSFFSWPEAVSGGQTLSGSSTPCSVTLLLHSGRAENEDGRVTHSQKWRIVERAGTARNGEGDVKMVQVRMYQEWMRGALGTVAVHFWGYIRSSHELVMNLQLNPSFSGSSGEKKKEKCSGREERGWFSKGGRGDGRMDQDWERFMRKI